MLHFSLACFINITCHPSVFLCFKGSLVNFLEFTVSAVAMYRIFQRFNKHFMLRGAEGGRIGV